MSYPQHIQEAYQKALEVREKAHAPYSNFKVGCALKIKGCDQIFLGCNVENASYGATICAERNAMLNSVAVHGKGHLEWMIIVADTEGPTAPCGICRQVMSEFNDSDFPVYLGNLKEIQKEVPFNVLFPMPFDSLE